MGYHAKLSPSSAHRWTTCTASINEAEGIPNQNSAASMQGTVCHQICAEVLQAWIDGGLDPLADLDATPYLGRIMQFWLHPESESNGEDWIDQFACFDPVADDWITNETIDPCMEFTDQVPVTMEMIDAVNAGLQFVQERTLLTGGHLEVEQRVPIGHITGEPGASGTSDVVLIYGDMIESLDFKFGRHKVLAYEIIVPARGETPPVTQMNLQLAMYVLGAYHKFGLVYDIKRFGATIIQPFLNHVSEYQCTLQELLDLQDNHLAVKAEETRTNPRYDPTYDNCHFCRAKDDCAARRNKVFELALDGFTDAGAPVLKPAPDTMNLGAVYGMLDFIREWCDDIARKVWETLNAGHQVVRPDGLKYVLVQGRKGDRKWDNPEAVEKMLKGMRLRIDEMYKMKVIGPADVEKMAKVPKRKKEGAPPPKINRLQWAKLQERITQSEGGMSVALETDTRPILPSSADGFVDVSDDSSDLLN